MAEPLSDATLLERFVSNREEAAFVALVRRHGPRIERICRRILRNEHDVEDVFQATFLVLARKAARVPWRDSVSPWIDSVARRLALHARSGVARQQLQVRAITNPDGGPSGVGGRLPERFHPVVEPSTEVERRDLRRVLDDELRRLPEKYRAPVVLCDLEGHTREEAARQLGWPAGSMSRRLDRARSLLRSRLTQRGLALGVIGLASLAVAAAIGLGTNRGGPDSSVRPIMTAFRAVSDGGAGHGPVLAAAARIGGPQPHFARILPAARAADSAARRMRAIRPGRSGILWYRFTIEMSDSARDLERACEQSNAVAVVAAARRLQASCVSCHAAFGSAPVSADVPVSDRVSARLRPLDSPGEAVPTLLHPGRAGTDRRSREPTAGPSSPEFAPRASLALRSPGCAVPAVPFRLASNEPMGPNVDKVGAERRRFIRTYASPKLEPCPLDDSRRCRSTTRARSGVTEVVPGSFLLAC
jgi:RNA polymerase sigma-70 factor (ECF subfamily)